MAKGTKLDPRWFESTALHMLFELEVDVVRDRDVRPWRALTHYVTLAIEDQPSWSRMENEARNLAAWMCWHIRGNMVTAVRIVSVEI